MKTIWILAVLLIIGLGAGSYFLIAGNEIEVNQESPLKIRDAMNSMSAEEKAEFQKQTEEMAEVVMEKSEEMATMAKLLAEGEFIAAAHGVEGKALLIDDDGSAVLRFEDFMTDNGPNLHIYLASSLSDDDFVDLGKIRATKGNVNYEIPYGTDTERYDKVLVWCVPFKVLFSYADLG